MNLQRRLISWLRVIFERESSCFQVQYCMRAVILINSVKKSCTTSVRYCLISHFVHPIQRNTVPRNILIFRRRLVLQPWRQLSRLAMRIFSAFYLKRFLGNFSQFDNLQLSLLMFLLLLLCGGCGIG